MIKINQPHRTRIGRCNGQEEIQMKFLSHPLIQGVVRGHPLVMSAANFESGVLLEY